MPYSWVLHFPRAHPLCSCQERMQRRPEKNPRKDMNSTAERDGNSIFKTTPGRRICKWGTFSHNRNDCSYSISASRSLKEKSQLQKAWREECWQITAIAKKKDATSSLHHPTTMALLLQSLKAYRDCTGTYRMGTIHNIKANSLTPPSFLWCC